eukprot:m.117257 g.117257  ORF g.117257 m.117257 type:complete len:532 (-) comp28568_c0_seq1:146-1741(-)
MEGSELPWNEEEIRSTPVKVKGRRQTYTVSTPKQWSNASLNSLPPAGYSVQSSPRQSPMSFQSNSSVRGISPIRSARARGGSNANIYEDLMDTRDVNRSLSVNSGIETEHEIRRSLESRQQADVNPSSIHVHQSCPTCRGKGKIPKESLQRSELVALVPYSDARLKPRRTKQFVAMAIAVTLVGAIVTGYFCWPRDISHVFDINIPVQTASTEHCATIKNDFQCQELACNGTYKYNDTFCNISDESTFVPDNCPTNGCFCAPPCNSYANCQACGSIDSKVICNSNVYRTCTWETSTVTHHGPDGQCVGSTAGPNYFYFEFVVNVTNVNYMPATVHGTWGLSYSDYISGRIKASRVFTTYTLENNTALVSQIIPAQSTATVIIPMNLSIPKIISPFIFAANKNNSEEEVRANVIHWEVLQDVCRTCDDKCGANNSDVDSRNEFFLELDLNMTASVIGSAFDLSVNQNIGFWKQCAPEWHPITFSTTPHTSTLSHSTTIPRVSTTTSNVSTTTPPAAESLLRSWLRPQAQRHP